MVVIDTKGRKMQEVDLDKLRKGVVETHDIRTQAEKNIRDDLTNVPLFDKLQQSYVEYLPSVEEKKRVVKLIEKAAGVEVTGPLKEGQVEVKFTTLAEANKTERELTMELFEKYIADPTVGQLVREWAERGMANFGTGVRAFTNSITKVVYFISDNFEQFFSIECEMRGIAPGSPEAKKLKKLMILEDIIHELTHQAISQKYPLVGDCRDNSNVEKAKALMEYIGRRELKREDLTKMIDSIDEKVNVLNIYNEGIALYTTNKVLGKLGHAAWSERVLKDLRESDDELSTRMYGGLRFLEVIQIRTHENPIEFTVAHPPVKPEHLEHPDQYLEYVRKENP